MCFSASASFAASAALVSLGLLAVKKTDNKKDIPFFSIPFGFALQQAIEGLLWLSVNNSYSHLNLVLMYGFLFFAFIIWPLWVPYSLYSIERNSERKQTLLFFCVLGTSCSLYFLYRLIYFDSSVTVNSNLAYSLFMPESYYIPINILYGLCTVIPFFITTLTYAWLIGILLLLSYALSYYYYYCCLISVWCFFAALISGFIVLIAYKKHDTPLS